MPKFISSLKALSVAVLPLMSCIFFLKMPICFTDAKFKCAPYGQPERALQYAYVGTHRSLGKPSQQGMRP